MTRYETTVNTTGDEISAAGITNAQALAVERNGTGLKIVSFGTETISAEPIFRFLYRSTNPSAPVPSGAFMNLLGYGSNGDEYVAQVSTGSVVPEGSTYFITMQGVQVYYVSVAGDDRIDVQIGLKAAIDAATYPTEPVTVTVDHGIFHTLQILQNVNSQPVLQYRPPGYFIAKSGHFFNEGGSQYVFDEQVNLGYETPTVPAVAASYDFNTYGFTGVPNVLAYLFDPGYPVKVLYFTALHGTADITNFPDFGTTLAGHEVLIDEGSNIFRFGQPFELGNFEVITVLYKT